MCIDEICLLTRKTMDEWEEPFGWSPNSAAEKLTEAMKPWMIQLSDCLRIWVAKDLELTDGELILAKTNLGALIECWLKFFYCVYYEDYLINPVKKRGVTMDPSRLTLEDIKIFSRGKLWEQGDDWDRWVERIQHQRNAIHAFNHRDIGDALEFCNDCKKFYCFIKKIIKHLPESPVEVWSYY